MKIRAPRRIASAAALAWCLGLLGCGSDSPTAPGIQPQIANLADDFSYQISNVRNYSGTAIYHWRNTGTSANVNQATAITSGRMTLILADSTGAQLYSRSLADNGTFVTANGAAGLWTIRVTYTGASGTVNFRVQKKT